MNVFDLVAKISIDSSEYDRGLDSAAGKTKGFGSKVGGLLGGVAKVGVASLAAVSGAVLAMSKGAVSSYSRYEQLVGGVDKLYGAASGKLQQYADNAFMTAGMSANQYMETATSFSAALINSLGGNTQKAADMTDVAMRAMSDNVNVFGSSMDSVQNAFQGFAKQNYTMLDNLKLGYGGTKSEMERLIKDANDYRKSIGQSSDLSIEKFGDIVQAIQSVQEKQGIAGATTQEAMKTIEGSANATKAAWQNVITAIGRGEGLKDAMAGLTTALFGQNAGEGLLNRVIPRIQTTMEGIATLVTTAGPMIAQKLPEIASAVIPSLLSTAVSVIEALGDALPGLVGVLGSSLVQVGMDIGNQLIDAISTVLNDMFPKLGKGFDGIVSAAREGIEKIKQFWSDNGEEILAKASEVWENVKSAVSTAVEAIGVVIRTVIDVAKQLWEQWGADLVEIAASYWNLISVAITTAITIIQGIITTVVTAISEFWTQHGETIKAVASAAWSVISAVISGALNIIKGIIAATTAAIQGNWSGVWSAVLGILSTIWGTIKSVVSAAISAVASVISSVLNNIKNVFSNVWNGIKSTVTSAINAVKSAISSGINAAYSTVSSVLSNIKSKFTSVFESVKSTVTNAINTVKGAFNFSWSLPPIRLPHISVSGSFSLNPPSVPSFGISWYKKAMDNAYMLNGATIFGSMGGKLLGGGETGKEILIGESRAIDLIRKASGDREPVNVTINVYARENQDVNALADVISRKLQKQLDSRSRVYA